ncbi:uncharacterized protein AAGF69_005932 [Amazona ochrocephala]
MPCAATPLRHTSRRWPRPRHTFSPNPPAPAVVPGSIPGSARFPAPERCGTGPGRDGVPRGARGETVTTPARDGAGAGTGTGAAPPRRAPASPGGAAQTRPARRDSPWVPAQHEAAPCPSLPASEPGSNLRQVMLPREHPLSPREKEKG